MKKEELEQLISFDKFGKLKNGNYYIIKGFFYESSSSTAFAKNLKDVLPEVNIIKKYNVLKDFNRNKPVEKQSHYYVEFNIVPRGTSNV